MPKITQPKQILWFATAAGIIITITILGLNWRNAYDKAEHNLASQPSWITSVPGRPHPRHQIPVPKLGTHFSIYIAAPLFTDAERQFNLAIKGELSGSGYSVILPQELAEKIVAGHKPGWQQKLFRTEQDALRRSDVVLCVLDGPDVDSGTAWEVDLAYSLNKPIIGIRTDFRSFGDEGRVNLMLEQSCESIINNVADIKGIFPKREGK